MSHLLFADDSHSLTLTTRAKPVYRAFFSSLLFFPVFGSSVLGARADKTVFSTWNFFVYSVIPILLPSFFFRSFLIQRSAEDKEKGKDVFLLFFLGYLAWYPVCLLFFVA